MNTDNFSSNFSNELESINSNLNDAYNSIKNTSNLYSPLGENTILSKSVLDNNSFLSTNSTTPEFSTDIKQTSILYSGWFLFMLFIILSFLGINVMYIVTKGSKLVGNVGTGIFGYLNGLLKWIILQLKNLLNITGEGTKTAVDIVTKTGDAGLNIIEKTIDAPKHIIKDNIGNGGVKDAIYSGLDIPVLINNEKNELVGTEKDNKGGYCYIGTNNNTGSCMYVDRGDLCMSKNIYPTMDMCINKDNLERK
jgi:hypothetical protein